MANNNTFKLGLKLLEPSDWEHFESLCSSFLVSEFINLRTMAHPSGDGGRDSELFSPENITMIATQYSVTPDWKPKIKQTVKRIKEGFPDVRILIYLSNKVIGGQADELKKELLDKHGISLDTRDQNWFLERMELNDTNRVAATDLSNRIASPYLEGEKVINKKSSALTTNESKAALLYLGLQWQDDTNDKGLTKICFDSLVRSALRHTHSERRLTRSDIHQFVHRALPSTNMDESVTYIDSALNRLKKRFIKHWVKDDEFCLSHEEHLRISSRIAERELEEACFQDELTQDVTTYLQALKGSTKDDESDLIERIPRIIEKLLLKKGESFVSAVSNDSLNGVGHEHLRNLIFIDLEALPSKSLNLGHYPSIIEGVITNTLNHPTDATRIYLRRLANSYTLLSFLNETPDVQTATKKLFSHGTIWLDTTVILPLIAEQLNPDPDQRRQTILFDACMKAGIKVSVKARG